jgi:hypothetical protein
MRLFVHRDCVRISVLLYLHGLVVLNELVHRTHGNPHPGVMKYPPKSLRGENETGIEGLASDSTPSNAMIFF